ncbi:MAG: hypothetical protein ACR2N6_09000 [Miltoncostaeaceae bacterium]
MRDLMEDSSTPGRDDTGARAAELSERARLAEQMTADIRGRRDQAIIAAIEAGWTTRAIGELCSLTASQISTIWRRERPARPRRAPAG